MLVMTAIHKAILHTAFHPYNLRLPSLVCNAVKEGERKENGRKRKETERDVTRLPLLSTLSSLAGLIRQEDA